MAQHGVGVVGADEHEVEPAQPVGHGRQLDVAGLAHRAGVERRDLAHVLVGGADEPRGVGDVADVHRQAVDAVALEPTPIVEVEVGADRPDESRGESELRHAEGDVRRDSAPTNHKVIDEERQ